MPAQKAAAALSVRQVYPNPADALYIGLQKYALNLTGDSYRDLDTISLVRDPADPATTLFCGTWQGTLRFAATLAVSNHSGEIILLATKGQTAVDPSIQFGTTGPDIGNHVLIAATLHIAIFYLRAAGLVALTNQPYNARLRAKYELMGFRNGTHLVLDDAPSLEKAFTYIDDAYQRRGLNLSRPPLPL